MTFKEIQDDALERLNLTSAEARTRVKRYINEWYRRILTRLGLSRLRDASNVTVTMVPGTAEYDVTAAKIASVFEPTGQVVLVERSLAWIRDMDPAETYTAASPVVYAVRKVGATSLKIRLWPIPAVSGTLKLDTSSGTTALSADGDVPVLPEDYHWILSLAARSCEYEKLSDDRFVPSRRDLDAAVSELRYYVAKSHTKQWSQGGKEAMQSRLGAAYTE